jgi:hypothetical protein
MAVTIGRLKCCLCGKKTGILKSVHQYGEYGGVGGRHHYHQECLELVEMYPEKYGHRITDMAININDLHKDNDERFNSHIIENYKKQVEKLKKTNFERMMPKK